MQRFPVVIIGAGPTGLGAAQRLDELGAGEFLVLERNAHPGGLAASFTDDAGFTWDIGGHVLFSHYEYFDRLVDRLMGDDFLEHQRESWVRACGTWVPYPFQNNVRHLPKEDLWRCVRGLLPGRRPEGPPENFHQWIEHVFGRGIAETFLWPYNYKVWATPPELMGFSWIGERVSMVELEGVLENVLFERDDVAWGPNNTFRFPAAGGTGEIFRRLAATLGGRIRYGSEVAGIDAGAKTVTTTGGETLAYDTLISTAPLDTLCRDWLHSPGPALADAAEGLAHNSVHVSGIGVEGTDVDWPGEDSRCWMYFPEDDCPFYRVTNFHNYAPANVPAPGAQRALMCETSMSAHKPEDPATLAERAVQGLVNTTLLRGEDTGRIATRWQYLADYAYPVPTLGRDAALAAIQPRLEALGIFSRGRFGGWKYEVGNMDHSVMQGVELADRLVSGTPETTYTWTKE